MKLREKKVENTANTVNMQVKFLKDKDGYTAGQVIELNPIHDEFFYRRWVLGGYAEEVKPLPVRLPAQKGKKKR